MSSLRIRLLGGAWISGNNHGFFHSAEPVLLSPAIPELKDLENVCAPLPHRYGRFNHFSKTGFLAMALTFRDAGLTRVDPNCGIIFSTQFETISTDQEYYRTTLDEGGSCASPNLFPYTLPVIAAGEAASFFKLTGPTLCVGDDGTAGRKALRCAVMQLVEEPDTRILVGWIEMDGPARGAIFTLLEAGCFPAGAATFDIDPATQSLVNSVTEHAIGSLLDFCPAGETCRS